MKQQPTAMSARFFGHPESPLFGVYHAPRGKSRRNNVRAAVVCPPIGQEYIRTHWCLRLLAKQLGRVGINVLRLDYHGLGDSFGTPEQIRSLTDWTRDIEQAIAHLKEESGAHTVMLIGQRFGATLAANVAVQRHDVNSIVLWEPVIDGQAYVAELRSMHAQMLDLWVCSMKTPNDRCVEEILGTRYCRSLLDEIEQTRLQVDEIVQPQLVVDAKSKNQVFTHPEPSLLRFIVEPNAGNWNDLSVLETARLRPHSTRTIMKSVEEMFTRLERFGALIIDEDVAGFQAIPGREGLR